MVAAASLRRPVAQATLEDTLPQKEITAQQERSPRHTHEAVVVVAREASVQIMRHLTVVREVRPQFLVHPQLMRGVVEEVLTRLGGLEALVVVEMVGVVGKLAQMVRQIVEGVPAALVVVVAVQAVQAVQASSSSAM